MVLEFNKKPTENSIDYTVYSGNNLIMWAFKYPKYSITSWEVSSLLGRKVHLSRIEEFSDVLKNCKFHPSHEKPTGIFITHSPISVESNISLDGKNIESDIITHSKGFLHIRFSTPFGNVAYEKWDREEKQGDLYGVASHLQISKPLSEFVERTSNSGLRADSIKEVLEEIYTFT